MEYMTTAAFNWRSKKKATVSVHFFSFCFWIFFVHSLYMDFTQNIIYYNRYIVTTASRHHTWTIYTHHSTKSQCYSWFMKKEQIFFHSSFYSFADFIMITGAFLVISGASAYFLGWSFFFQSLLPSLSFF